MTPLNLTIAVTGTLLGGVPAAYLFVRDKQGYVVLPHWWWLSLAFGISFLSDAIALFIQLRWLTFQGSWVIGAVYPATQATLFGAVLILDPRKKWGLLAFLTAVGIYSVVLHDVKGPEYLLHTAAFLSVCWMVWPLKQLGVLRWSLLSYCGLFLVYWLIFLVKPNYTTYLLYQSARLLGALLFCVAASHPYPKLRLVSAQRAA